MLIYKRLVSKTTKVLTILTSSARPCLLFASSSTRP